MNSQLIKIKKSDVCNLSRIPIGIEKNPCYRTAKQIIDMEKAGTTFNAASYYKESPLYKHYISYSPDSIYSLYNAVDKLKKYTVTSPFLPWIYKKPLKTMTDIAFISFETEGFVYKQVLKIKQLIDSFRENGYNPKQFPDRKQGNITGYFIKKNNLKRFYIVSGNHRTSVFFALFPDQELPVSYESVKFAKPRELQGREKSNFLKVYDSKDAPSWASVRSGFLTPTEAQEIMEVYLNV